MSVHVQTGNMLEVVYDCDEKGNKKFIGLYDRINHVQLSIVNPIGLMEVLYKVLKECGEI